MKVMIDLVWFGLMMKTLFSENKGLFGKGKLCGSASCNREGDSRSNLGATLEQGRT